MGSIQSSSGAYLGTCRRQSARPGAVFVSAPRCLILAPPINPNVLFTGRGRRPVLGATRAALISPRVTRSGSDGFAKSVFFFPLHFVFHLTFRPHQAPDSEIACTGMRADLSSC